jgi:preprotein translocase subunit YajC
MGGVGGVVNAGEGERGLLAYLLMALQQQQGVRQTVMWLVLLLLVVGVAGAAVGMARQQQQRMGVLQGGLVGAVRTVDQRVLLQVKLAAMVL